jgi:hypothetical protein
MKALETTKTVTPTSYSDFIRTSYYYSHSIYFFQLSKQMKALETDIHEGKGDDKGEDL